MHEHLLACVDGQRRGDTHDPLLLTGVHEEIPTGAALDTAPRGAARAHQHAEQHTQAARRAGPRPDPAADHHQEGQPDQEGQELDHERAEKADHEVEALEVHRGQPTQASEHADRLDTRDETTLDLSAVHGESAHVERPATAGDRGRRVGNGVGRRPPRERMRWRGRQAG